MAAFDACLTIRQKQAEANSTSLEYNGYLGASHACRGVARCRAGQPAEAASDLRRSLEFSAKFPPPLITMQLERSRALALLAGLVSIAKSGVTKDETKDETKTFADQSVAALVAVVKRRWALPSELKEPDFDAVRGRADFQKLVAEVEAKAEKANP